MESGALIDVLMFCCQTNKLNEKNLWNFQESQTNEQGRIQDFF